MQRNVGISELKVSGDITDVFVARSLASGIALALYDPANKVGGLIRCMLPSAEADREQATASPEMFADLGIDALIAAIEKLGGETKNLTATLVGASDLMGGSEIFQLGLRNRESVHKALASKSISLSAEDIGGSASRDVSFRVADGCMTVSSQGNKTELSAN